MLRGVFPNDSVTKPRDGVTSNDSCADAVDEHASNRQKKRVENIFIITCEEWVITTIEVE